MASFTGFRGAPWQLARDAVQRLRAVLLRYLCDINPTVSMAAADRAALPAVGPGASATPGATDLTLTYRLSSLATGLTVNVQTSPDLLTWTTVPANQLDLDQVLGTDPISADMRMKVGVKISDPNEFLRPDVTSP